VKLLLDTHALLWWAFGSAELSRRPRALIADPANKIYVSSASAWEISTKHRLGPHRDPFDRMLAAQSLLDDLPIVGRDEVLKEFGVALVW
jgi:PIN domain nuclease of toxin-antitoxin system